MLCRSNLRDVYWSPGQMLAHYASSGYRVRTGDLLGTDTTNSFGYTVKEPRLGCLFKLTIGGKKAVRLKSKRELTWLKDENKIILKG
jgi:fumarylacetoacetase